MVIFCLLHNKKQANEQERQKGKIKTRKMSKAKFFLCLVALINSLHHFMYVFERIAYKPKLIFLELLEIKFIWSLMQQWFVLIAY